MIYTSYFGMSKKLIENGIEPIAISRSVPKNFAGRRILSLAPTWAMLRMSDEEYDENYKKILQNNDIDAIVDSFNGTDVALLCWEKDVNDCHRKQVAEWLIEHGYEVKEFEPKQKHEESEQKEEIPKQMTIDDFFRR